MDQLAHKLTLSVPETVALSGLPRRIIKNAIANGELSGRKAGRNFRIHRDNLEIFLRDFFKQGRDEPNIIKDLAEE